MDGHDDPAVGTGIDGRWVLKPEPQALAEDFRKLTDAQLSMIFHLIGQARR
ncbi:hypothetical protein [Solimonas variicoloris]|uniref:hypothetical protein n=1 Tax=Solimonas variicoloris TaxID=254408 RepID=UPI00037C07BC|nr:hypothetical protein [Solimonas variicoloris]